MPPSLPGPTRPLSWSHGSAEVRALSGAIHHLEFWLPDGSAVAPLAEAPWHDDDATTRDGAIPAHLRFLGGEWPCVPFGRTEADPVVHGFGTDNLWRFEEGGEGVALSIDYPEDHPIARLRRTVRGVPGEARVEFTLAVTARRDCVLPVGLHPILALGTPGEAVRVEGAFSHGETFPVVFEPGVSRLRPAARFETPDLLPLAEGGTVSFGDLLKATTEEAFQLYGADGTLRIVYPQSGHAVRLDWNAERLSGLPVLGLDRRADGEAVERAVSRVRGRAAQCAFRREGRAGRNRRRPRNFRAGETWTTRYFLGVERS